MPYGKYPHIKVLRDTTITGTESHGKLIKASQAGTLPDVFVTDNVPTLSRRESPVISTYWNKDPDAQLVYEKFRNRRLQWQTLGSSFLSIRPACLST